ncbi:MAG: hypothetical protein KGZ81_05910 [Flavobacteriales bacterium]|nr:hypothetical protein [Flavobacteriales bacterium]
MSPIKELLKETIELQTVFIHKPSGLKIGVLGDNVLPPDCEKIKDHPPLQVLEHIYVASHQWEDITDHHVERLEDLDKLLQICTEGKGKEDLVVISKQLLDVIREHVNDKPKTSDL